VIRGWKIEQNRGGIHLSSASSITITENQFASNSIFNLPTGEDGFSIPSGWYAVGAENQEDDVLFSQTGGTPTNIHCYGNRHTDTYTSDTSRYHYNFATGTNNYIYNNLIPASQAATSAFNTLNPNTIGTNTANWTLRNNGPGAMPSGPTTVASATTVAALPPGPFAYISGTTTITSIRIDPNVGREVTIKFTGALTLTDGSNLVLNGNYVTSADDTITLISDGTNWVEKCRSAN
jgi:parallel beta-helix repeat protein